MRIVRTKRPYNLGLSTYCSTRAMLLEFLESVGGHATLAECRAAIREIKNSDFTRLEKEMFIFGELDPLANFPLLQDK